VVVDVLTIVLLAISPLKESSAIHFVVFELALEDSSIWKDLHSLAMQIVFLEFSEVLGTILPHKVTIAFLNALSIVAFVGRSIRPGFLSLSVELVVDPLAFLFAPLDVLVDSLAKCLV
jgi:hypothetical protein